jgi:hypothetical protein
VPERYRDETRPIVINQRKNSDSNLYFPRYDDQVWPASHGLVTNAYSSSCANELIFSYLWWLFRFGSEISHPKGFRRILIMLSIQRKIIALLWRYRPRPRLPPEICTSNITRVLLSLVMVIIGLGSSRPSSYNTSNRPISI